MVCWDVPLGFAIVPPRLLASRFAHIWLYMGRTIYTELENGRGKPVLPCGRGRAPDHCDHVSALGGPVALSVEVTGGRHSACATGPY